MAIKKSTKNATTALVNDVKELAAEVGRVSADVKKLAKLGQKKIESLDEKTKKQAVAALGALAALLTISKVAKSVTKAIKKK